MIERQQYAAVAFQKDLALSAPCHLAIFAYACQMIRAFINQAEHIQVKTKTALDLADRKTEIEFCRIC